MHIRNYWRMAIPNLNKGAPPRDKLVAVLQRKVLSKVCNKAEQGWSGCQLQFMTGNVNQTVEKTDKDATDEDARS